jgi:hypothetical protein
MDTLLHGLQEVESTGKELIGDDIMAEEESRAAADNVRLAVAAAHKRSLPPPTVTAEAIKARRVVKKPAAPAPQTDTADDETAEADEAEDESEAAEVKSPRSPRVA